MKIEDLSDCMDTFEKSLQRLEEVENKLAVLLGGFTGIIPGLDTKGTLREWIIWLDCTEQLHEDGWEGADLVRDWQQDLSSYIHYLKDDHPEKYTEWLVYMNLCHYDKKGRYMSFPQVKSEFYQKIVKLGKDAIPSLLKYSDSFGWVTFSLLNQITKNECILLPIFPKEYSGIYDKVKGYYLAWGKNMGYIEC